MKNAKELATLLNRQWRAEALNYDTALDAARELVRLSAENEALMVDALGEQRKRYVRITHQGGNMVTRPEDAEEFIQSELGSTDASEYALSDVYLSDREYEDLPEFDGF